MTKKTQPAEHGKAEAERAYYIVNPAGAVHVVTREHARERLKADARWRLATDAEIAAYREVVVQRHDRPIAALQLAEED